MTSALLTQFKFV